VSPIIVAATTVVVGHIAALLTLWLRLRAQLQREHAFRRRLVDVARAMPEGGQIYERHSDGTHLVVAVTPIRARERTGG
jgi:hypothetical protein